MLQGDFVLDCPKIELIPSNSSDKKDLLSGSGYISLNEEGYFDLKVYVPNEFGITDFLKRLNWESGRVIGDEFYYNLIAHDMSGNIWHAEKFIPHKNSSPNGSMIVGSIPGLHCSEDLSQRFTKHVLHMHFNEAIMVPLNTVVEERQTIGEETRKWKKGIGLARFEAGNLNFEIETSDTFTSLTATTDAFALTDIKINRIFEAFYFVTGCAESWSVLKIIRNGNIETRIRAVNKNKKKSRTPPPIIYHKIQDNNSVWKLFDCYLQFVFTNDADYYHPISTLVHSVIESGKSSLDVETLTLSVTIESLLKSELCHLYSIDDNLNRNIFCVSQLVRESGALDADFRRRMLGSISAMKDARAKDILLILKQLNLIDEVLVKTYGKLRNKTAHGVRDSGADIQNYFNQTSTVLVLFFQLVFLIIRYKGEYTDYGTYGYPTKVFVSQLP